MTSLSRTKTLFALVSFNIVHVTLLWIISGTQANVRLKLKSSSSSQIGVCLVAKQI